MQGTCYESLRYSVVGRVCSKQNRRCDKSAVKSEPDKSDRLLLLFVRFWTSPDQQVLQNVTRIVKKGLAQVCTVESSIKTLAICKLAQQSNRGEGGGVQLVSRKAVSGSKESVNGM